MNKKKKEYYVNVNDKFLLKLATTFTWKSDEWAFNELILINMNTNGSDGVRKFILSVISIRIRPHIQTYFFCSTSFHTSLRSSNWVKWQISPYRQLPSPLCLFICKPSLLDSQCWMYFMYLPCYLCIKMRKWNTLQGAWGRERRKEKSNKRRTHREASQNRRKKPRTSCLWSCRQIHQGVNPPPPHLVEGYIWTCWSHDDEWPSCLCSFLLSLIIWCWL